MELGLFQSDWSCKNSRAEALAAILGGRIGTAIDEWAVAGGGKAAMLQPPWAGTREA